MPLLVWLVFLLVGRLLVWLLQTSGLLRWFWALAPALTELQECDLCLGFWVYLGLALISPAAFGLWPWWAEIIILAAGTSFAGHLLGLGWHAKFGTTVIQ